MRCMAPPSASGAVSAFSRADPLTMDVRATGTTGDQDEAAEKVKQAALYAGLNLR